MPEPASKPRLILHAGLHKTGTTAFQRFCRDNRKQLRELGLWYPDYGDLRSHLVLNHHEFVEPFADEREGRKSLTESEARAVVNYWERSCGNSTILLSSEAICRQKRGGPVGDWRSHREAFLRSLKDALHAFDVYPVVVLRMQDDFVRSAYLENVAKGSKVGSLSFSEFVVNCRPEKLQFLANLEIFHKVFGSVLVLQYEEIKANVQAAILAPFGFDVSSIPAPGIVRESMDSTQARLKRRLNRRLSGVRPPILRSAANRLLNRAISWRFVTRTAARLMRDGATTGLWESPEQRAAFLASFSAENAAIAQRFIGAPASAITNARPTLQPARPGDPRVLVEGS